MGNEAIYNDETPKREPCTELEPEIKVPVDIAMVENEQKSVDEGHSPWKLDPIFVTQVFASLLILPEGIVGEYPIPYDAIRITHLNTSEATTRIVSNKSLAKCVFLKRLVRQNGTGIWSVVGYSL